MKKTIAIILAATAVISAAACGAPQQGETPKRTSEPKAVSVSEPLPTSAPEPEPTEVPQREEMNGFDESTNQTVKLGCFELSVPEYWGEGEKGEVQVKFVINDFGSVCIAFIAAGEMEGQNSEFEKNVKDGIATILEQYNIENYDTTEEKCCIANMPGYFFSSPGTVNDHNCTVEGVVAFDENIGEIFIAMIVNSDESECSFSEDFRKVIESVTVIDESETGIDPDFKAALDSYEEFMDEYVEFMKEFNDNPSDLNLLMKYVDILAKYEEMADKINNMDEDEMTAEELEYYIDVTSRVSKKLLSVLG